MRYARICRHPRPARAGELFRDPGSDAPVQGPSPDRACRGRGGSLLKVRHDLDDRVGQVSDHAAGIVQRRAFRQRPDHAGHRDLHPRTAACLREDPDRLLGSEPGFLPQRTQRALGFLRGLPPAPDHPHRQRARPTSTSQDLAQVQAAAKRYSYTVEVLSGAQSKVWLLDEL